MLFQTFVVALTLGVFVTILAKKLETSAIALLLVFGVLVGPEVLNIVDPIALGEGIETLVSLAVAVILFEGGLTLDYSGYRQTSRVIRRLLSLGVLITWGLTAYLSYLFFQTDFAQSLLIGSLVIVTGPTVITPLLRRIKVNNRLHQILHWEGVLNDPIGVFISITCFEVVLSQGASADPFYDLFLRLTAGLICGVVIGYLAQFLLERKWIPEEQTNVFSFAVAIATFGIADFIVHESGLLAVVVAGFILGIKKTANLESVKKFKLELTEILIGLIFILISANLDLEKIKLFGKSGFFLVLGILFIVRPASVFACTMKEKISFNEKLFLSWIAPRGIVAASMATLFALKLEAQGNPLAWLVEIFTFCVIGSTVILQGFSAGLVAKWLNVRKKKPRDYLIIGANELAVKLGHWIENNTDAQYVIADTNKKNINALPIKNKLSLNAMEVDLILSRSRVDIGQVLALTDNEELNALLADTWAKVVGVQNVFRWASLDDHLKNRHGKEIWKFLPKPNVVSLELARNETQLLERTAWTKRKDIYFLCATDAKQIFFSEEASSIPQKLLYVRRSRFSLKEFLGPNHIFLMDGLPSKKFYETAAEKIVERYPHLPKDRISYELLEQEKQQATAIGEGVAIPHVYLSALNSPICLFIQIKRGLPWPTPDKKPIQLIFILLSPKGDSERHLSMLAQITHFVSDAKTKQKLIQAPDVQTIAQIIDERLKRFSL